MEMRLLMESLKILNLPTQKQARRSKERKEERRKRKPKR
jgi:hypothetical protein